ncbi:MFS transporter, partial [Cronobacter sakazakii]
MHMHGLSLQDANLGIQWHVIAMYAPGFFTGKLITRFGATRIAALGLAISALSVVAGLAGTAVGHYWLLLILLGVGWNFGFTGASAQILDYHRPEEKNRVQSLNDFVVFGVMIVGSFSSGALLTLVGWNAVLWCSLVPLVVAMIALLAEKRRAAASLNRY